MFRLAIVALLACGALTGASIAAEAAPSPSPVPVPQNTSVKDGGVFMSIGGVDCAHPTAGGEACYVTFHAVNGSDGFPVFTEADQSAYDPAGRAFHPDPAADAVANHGMAVTQRLPRGPAVSGILVFILPAGDRIDHVVLHGQSGTPGESFTVRGA